MSAVTPFAACWSISAPEASSSSMTSVGTLVVTATMRGVSPASLRAWTSAPSATAACRAAASPASTSGKMAGTGGGDGSRCPKGGKPKAKRPPSTSTTTRTAASNTRMPGCYRARRRGYRGPVPQTVTRELRALLTVAAPLVLAQLAQNGMSFIDTVMVGRLGAIPLAGLALGAVAFNFVYLITMAFAMAVNPVVAQAVGAGDHAKAARAARNGVILAGAVSVPSALLVTNLLPVLRLTGQDEQVLAGAGAYLRAVALGLPGALVLV